MPPLPPAPPRIASTVDLARYLGISEWTVSRAINGHPEVKAATRERILQAMEEVGFRPNPVARGLNGKAMGVVGVCFGDPRNAVMIEKIASLDRFLHAYQLRGVLSISHRDEASEGRILSDFRHMRVDGVVLIQSFLGAKALSRLSDGMRCVHVDPAEPELFPSVTMDRGAAMRLIVDHLVGLGHRSFALLGFGPTSAVRWNGVRSALAAHGLDPDRSLETFELEQAGHESFVEGVELAGRLARRLKAKGKKAAKRPTAVIALNDRIAIGAIQTLVRGGIAVPRDLSVVGFDDLDIGSHLLPTLTTINQQPEMLMQRVGELLLGVLGKPAGSSRKRLHVEPRLMVRESTGPASRS
ncbi:transcriptional regulator, LacI family [Verrucomicrobium sp. GAS474]|uniref:LacI family DNA-binding transcriptional regulator n=1 Tax=Verrucomicrobium sp. GAS474 TaxID=1882831 RepID=UPI00087DB92E|nr:LacI family DNA-binding transcriptional regulator [Verrucomicrobium sp. GAS474]SDU29421.1 transcriptional regulator, LacI family [Verrucomicrobium sp. GAS474]